MDNWIRFYILIKYREYIRDKAFLEYGDKWREHVFWGGHFKPEPQNDNERQFLETIDNTVNQHG